MALVVFPTAPAIDEIFAANGLVWIWTGYAWRKDIQALGGTAPATTSSRAIFPSVASIDYQFVKPVLLEFV